MQDQNQQIQLLSQRILYLENQIQLIPVLTQRVQALENEHRSFIQQIQIIENKFQLSALIHQSHQPIAQNSHIQPQIQSPAIQVNLNDSDGVFSFIQSKGTNLIKVTASSFLMIFINLSLF
jgi:hypothetical protein